MSILLHRSLRVFSALCVLLCALPALAQSAPAPSSGTSQAEQTTDRAPEPTPDDGQTAPATTEPEQDKTAATPAKQRRSDDIFRPSEEISEDFAVSFPVDI